MKRFLSATFAGLLVASSIALFVSSSASAASVFDNTYQTTEKLFLKQGETFNVDATYLISQILNTSKFSGGDNPNDFYDRYGMRPYFTGLLQNDPHEREKMRNDWFNNAKRWSMSQACYASGSICDIFLVGTRDESLHLEWKDNSNNPNGLPNQAIAYGSNKFLIKITANSSGGYIIISYVEDQRDNASELGLWISSSINDFSSYSVKNYLFYGDPNYPEGYSGDEIVDEIIMKTIVKPNFTYNVNLKDLTATHIGEGHTIPQEILDEYNKNGYYLNQDAKLEWFIRKKDSTDILKFEILDQSQTFKYSVPDIGEYILEARYVVQPCYKYSYDTPGSTTPDYCFTLDISSNKNYKDIALRPTRITLNIDGNPISGDTRAMECDFEDGTCIEPSPYEDCSVHDWLFSIGDVSIKIPSPDSIGCTIRNSFIWMRENIIYPLFIPDLGQLNGKFNELTDRFKHSLGLLWSPFDFIIKTFQLFTEYSANPTGQYCSLGSFQMFGRGQAASIELCRWRDQLPQLWNLMQLALKALLSFFVVFGWFSLFKRRILGIQDEDHEEDHDTHEVRWHDERTGDVGNWERKRK